MATNRPPDIHQLPLVERGPDGTRRCRLCGEVLVNGSIPLLIAWQRHYDERHGPRQPLGPLYDRTVRTMRRLRIVQ